MRPQVMEGGFNFIGWEHRIDAGNHASWLDDKPPALKAGERIQCPHCQKLYEPQDLLEVQWVFDVGGSSEQSYCKNISPPCHPANTTVMKVVDANSNPVGVYNGDLVLRALPREV